MMRKFLEARGVEIDSAKATFRRAAKEKIIHDPEIRFVFQKMRNLTIHTYNQESTNEIIQIFNIFSEELTKPITNLSQDV